MAADTPPDHRGHTAAHGKKVDPAVDATPTEVANNQTGWAGGTDHAFRCETLV